MQPALFHESIQDALREVIRAAGGAKIVGSKLWPSLPVDQAASKISDCLNPDRRQHFNETEVLHLLRLLRLGREVECHAGLHYIASICGYSQPEPVTPADEVQALQQQFILATKELKAMSQRLEAITARANLQAVR